MQHRIDRICAAIGAIIALLIQAAIIAAVIGLIGLLIASQTDGGDQGDDQPPLGSCSEQQIGTC